MRVEYRRHEMYFGTQMALAIQATLPCGCVLRHACTEVPEERVLPATHMDWASFEPSAKAALDQWAKNASQTHSCYRGSV